MNGLTFRFNNPAAWAYPAGLESALTQTLEQQGIQFVAAVHSSTMLVLWQGTFYFLWDNGGELGLQRVNDDTGRHIPMVSDPLTIRQMALTMTVRILAALRNQPIDYGFVVGEGD
jgi:hypothetical protein